MDPNILAAAIMNQDAKETAPNPVISAITQGLANQKFGLNPYQPGYNFPQDVGLGGISTEYTATDYDPQGQVFNYPQIWYDQEGRAIVLPQDQAYNQAVSYENGSGLRFPRFNSLGNAETYAEHRSAMGGAEETPLASVFGLRNW